MILTIIGGLASVIGFATAGSIADKIGRKWTIAIGLLLTVLGYIVMSIVGPTKNIVGVNGEYSFPTLLYVVWVIKGFGMSLVHNCSFPMIVELCSAKKIGQFTGYYYTSSMAAQTVTPVLLGLLLTQTSLWGILPIYSAVLLAVSSFVFIVFVKNIKASKVKNTKGLEALGQDD